MKLGLSNPKTIAPSLMVERYPEQNEFSNLHDKDVEDHFKVVLWNDNVTFRVIWGLISYFETFFIK